MLVKMCQVIGTRSDIFPREYVSVLSQCQDRLPAREFKSIQRVVEEDLDGAVQQRRRHPSPSAPSPIGNGRERGRQSAIP